MNEFDDGCSLTTVIKAREAAIVNLKEKLEESEEQYVALQATNAENWTKCNTLEKDVEHLRKTVRCLQQRVVEARDDQKYCEDNLKKEQDRSSAQEAAYLKVIKTLSGRD